MEKEIFPNLIKLADKKYSIEAIRIETEIKHKMDDAREKMGILGLGNSSSLAREILKINLSGIKEKIDKKFEIDSEIIISEIPNINEMKFLTDRLAELVDSEKSSLKTKLKENYGKFINEYDYQKLETEINSHLESKKIELEIKKEKSTDSKAYAIHSDNISEEIAKEIDYVNRYSKIIFKERLIEINEQRVILDLSGKCDDEKDFNNRILALNTILQWLNNEFFEKNQITKIGQVNKLEALLKKIHPNYDPEIIKIFRMIIKLRLKYPIHIDSQEFIDTAKEFNEIYPNIDWGNLWDKVIAKFIEALKRLRANLIEIREIKDTSQMKADKNVMVLKKQGMRIWETIFIEMKKGCTPISSFMGRFSDYDKRDKNNKEFLMRRWRAFLVFIEKDFVVACEEKEEFNRHYDREDLVNWQKKLKNNVVYILSKKGNQFLEKLNKAIKKGDKKIIINLNFND